MRARGTLSVNGTSRSDCLNDKTIASTPVRLYEVLGTRYSYTLTTVIVSPSIRCAQCEASNMPSVPHPCGHSHEVSPLNAERWHITTLISYSVPTLKRQAARTLRRCWRLMHTLLLLLLLLLLRQ